MSLIKQSYIISLIVSFFTRLASLYRESFIGRGLSNIFLRLGVFIDNSRIWTYFFEEDGLSKKWQKSKIAYYINRVLNFPIKLLRKLYRRYDRVFDSSIVISLAKFLSRHFYFLLGLALCAVVIIPDHRWYNAYMVLIGIAILLLFIFKSIFESDISIDISQMDISMFVFILGAIFAGVFSLVPRLSLDSLLIYLVTFMVALLLINGVKKEEDIESLVRFLILGLTLTLLYGIYQWKVVGIEVDTSLTDIRFGSGMSGRVYSTMGNPNIYGELLILLIPFTISQFLNEDKVIRKLVNLGIFGLSLILLLKTGSRSSWVSFAIALGIFVFLKKKILLIPMAALLIGMIPFLPASIYNRLMSIFNSNDTSLQYRKEILNPTKPMLKKYWITGVGLGQPVFKLIYERYKNAKLTKVAHTHNLFLQIWLEMGIYTLLALVWLGFRMIKEVIYLKNNCENKKLVNISIGALASLGGLIIMGFADHIWFYNRIFFMFWMNVAIILACIKLSKNEKYYLEGEMNGEETR